MSNNINNACFFSLRQIAAWQVPGMEAETDSVAGIPSLQRGAVWKPYQIEMLWDSIFRGLPFGSLVLSTPVDEQKFKHSPLNAKPAGNNESLIKYFILDGQQRCNAIAWGFANQWKTDLISDDQILWLDMCGECPRDKTRKFLFRLTTKAHPWGFEADNQSGLLSESKRRKALEEYHESAVNDLHKRPQPKEMMPKDAVVPVPLAILIEHFEECCEIDLDKLIHKLQTYPDALLHRVAERIRKNREKIESHLSELKTGLDQALNTKVYAIHTPTKLIEDIEQIFQRLNRQGTPLDNEELNYSMIKTYWPEVESVISGLAKKIVPDSRMINLAIRVALTQKEGTQTKLHGDLSVDQVREIFRDRSEANANNEKHSERREKIQDYIDKYLPVAIDWIDTHFLYDESRKYGIPPYLRSSIAWNSREVFGWLMWLSSVIQHPTEEQTKKILGIALSIHWFGIDRGRAVDKLFQKILEKGPEIDLENLRLSDLYDDDGQKGAYVALPLAPKEFEETFQLTASIGASQLAQWVSFWHGVVVNNSDGNKRTEPEIEERKRKYWEFLSRLKGQRELLVYVQREYISQKFSEFDPSNRLMWDGYNRPWDYDHILPQNKMDGRGGNAGQFHRACKEWMLSLGNLVAVDFVFNRQAQDTQSAEQKYGGKHGAELHACLNQMEAFVLDLNDTNDFDKSKRFVLAAKDRLHSLYRSWYDALKIESLS